MEPDKIQTYKQKFLIECQKIANGLTSTVITNQQIGNCFKELNPQEVFNILEHLEQDGLIEHKLNLHVPNPIPNKTIIKSFVLTSKGLS